MLWKQILIYETKLNVSSNVQLNKKYHFEDIFVTGYTVKYS